MRERANQVHSFSIEGTKIPLATDKRNVVVN